MYRIEVSPGEETVFRTIEELATAIRNGLVTVRSRIYHNASQKWLPIEFHPHYKKALENLDRPRPFPAAPAAAPAPKPVPAPEPEPPPPALASVPTRWTTPRVATPMAPEAANVEHRPPLPVARRRSGGARPIAYAGGTMVLFIMGYLVTTSFQSYQVAAEPVPAAASRAAPERDVAPAVEDDPLFEPEPAPSPPAPVITDVSPRSGPPSQAWSSSAGALAPPPRPLPPPAAAAAPESDLAPPPAAVDLAVPALLLVDSLAPPAGSNRDTAALNRILKAVSGVKANDPK